MNIYSHPDKLLISHLAETAEQAKSAAMLNNSPETPCCNNIIADVAYITGLFHDIGKAVSFFQDYLLDPGHKITGPKNHSLISAVMAKQAVSLYLQGIETDPVLRDILPYFSYCTVKRHHGALADFDIEMSALLEQKLVEELKLQVENFYEPGTDEIINIYSERFGVKYSFSVFKNYIISEEYLKDFRDYYFEAFIIGQFREMDKNLKTGYYYIFQLLYSSLLFADKHDVIIDGMKTGKANLVDFVSVNKYRDAKGFNAAIEEIDKLKNEAFFSSVNTIKKIFDPARHFYSITLPTGLGKTITSFAAALELLKIIDIPESKIIITIPFTSIIDQNFEVFDNILGKPDSAILLKHHHLADPVYKVNEDEISISKSRFLIETWESKVVVTTFVQLLEAILTIDKSKIMKFPGLKNSVIILDEIQTIEYKYWELINKTFKVIAEELNIYFILMTATRPLIFIPGKEIFETVEEYKKYFKVFNRTRLVNNSDTEISLEEYTDIVLEYAEKNKNKDVLVIFNTKNNCLSFFEKLCSLIQEEKTELYYLSTLITPFERKEIIKRIKTNPGGKRRIVVSTQLIEAGVDISMDTVFREFAPLDAIIQSAGRANRYSEKAEISDVFIYTITEGVRGSAKVYGADLLIKTGNILKGKTVIPENEFLDLIENYFKEVKLQSENMNSRELDYMAGFEFEKVNKFSLIQERKCESVFVQLNKGAAEAWKEYIMIYSDRENDIFRKRELFNKIKKTFYDFVINVPVPFDKKQIDFDSEPEYGFYVSKPENPSAFYSYSEKDFRLNTGYKPKQTMVF